MEWLSPAGLIGAFLGLVIGWVDYRIVAGVVEGRLRGLDDSETAADKAEFERRIKLMRVLLLAATVLAFPVIGYFAGRALGG
ncbi:hypothetical protein [Salinarimonas ramus]|uniref:Uncharacterized protein n=1 Tax=Salinarimonas ramus TaxID=690164 RepID=A0A917QK84_9HYPH|nr:hypothetical protein [Salinarimonas ramus]GGK53282.1 hypothetical protein GCM10011322_45160 [Salinarimonas ramus]